MNRSLRLFVTIALVFWAACLQAAEPLRVFIRAGVKTHGPDQHDHPRFLEEWTKLLNARGAKATGGMDWPTAEQLAQTDVVVMYAADAGIFSAAQKTDLESYLKRGGGLVVLHDAVCGNDAEWFKTVIGGAWQHGRAKWFEGDISLYYTQNESPITKGASNFDLDDEIYYELDMLPEAKVLASSWTPDERAKKNGRAFPHIYNVAPQIWTYEKDNHRAFVSIPGHNWKTFELPHYRAVLLRGIAWAGKRANLDELCAQQELAALPYPAGGPSMADKSRAQLDVHPDFEMKLVATEPLINKPMNIDWDPSGRLWVAETPEYPNGRRGMREDYASKTWKDHGGLVPSPGVQIRPGLDRISVLTDTNRDGVMDQKSVFAEGLELVTGMVFHRDGVIVTQAPDILFLRDTDNDGRADKIEKLYTGLGTSDTHAIINNPRWGFDGWIYATHGYSGTRDALSGDGSKHFGPIGSGVVRFKPDGSAIEQYSSKGGNTWGLTVTPDNELFWTQPTSGTILLHSVLSEAELARGKFEKTASFNVVIESPKTFPAMTWDQQAYRQIDLVGSFTAAAGTVLYDGGTWPAEYNGDFFTTEPTINLVHHERLTPKGVSFVGKKLPGREETEFVTSKDLWFRPIEVRVGPDGAMYVVDFYNQAVIHNDTRGPDHNKVNAAVRPDRDHYFGRLWRVNHKAAAVATVPDLAKADPAALAAALEHPSANVRMNAMRLLVEQVSGTQQLARLARDTTKAAPARIAALWALHRQGKLDDGTALAAAKDADAAVAKNGLRLAAAMANDAQNGNPDQTNAWVQVLQQKLGDRDPRVQLAAAQAIAARAFRGASSDDASVRLLTAKFSETADPFIRSAIISGAAAGPVAYLVTVQETAADSEGARTLIKSLCELASRKAEWMSDAIVNASTRGGSEWAPAEIIRALAASATADKAPSMTPPLQAALTKLLQTNAASAVLPLASLWDKQGALAPQVKALSAKELAVLNDGSAPDERRADAIRTLLSINVDIQAPLRALLTKSGGSNALKEKIIVELGDTSAGATGVLLVQAFPQLDPSAQRSALTQLLKRPEWVRALVGGIADKSIALTSLGAITLDRLRNHPDKAIAGEAQAAIQTVMGPQIAEKDKLIAQLLPQIESGGNVAAGKAMFTAACAVCHKLDGEGVQLGPELTGMGAHPRAELLTHIVDPNREVDPSFAAWSIELKDGSAYVGVITRENAQNVTIRDQAAEHEVAKSSVKSQVPMGRSLMPEGLEALGAPALRDILAFLEAGGGKFRIIDMSKAATADGRLGLFSSKETLGDNLEFKKYGNLLLGDVPFKVVDPAQASSGLNLIVLKGGGGFAKSFPQKVEISAPKVQATALHFLGGVAGWGFPFNSGELMNAPAAKVTVIYDGGKKEVLEFKNGVEFTDYVGRIDVPGSAWAPVVVPGKQMRVFRKALAIGGVIEKLILESHDNQLAPVFAGITAEQGDAKSAASNYGLATPPPAPPAPATELQQPVPVPPSAAKGVRALLVGGGSSHDFAKWFGEADLATLRTLNPAWIEFTQNANGISKALENVDVLVWSANQPISSETRVALMKFVAAGNGLVILHPGIWHNWENFPEWNKQIVGGGSRGHDKFGKFEVETLDATHPLLAGIPGKFAIADELYHSTSDAGSAPIKVLAQAKSPESGKVFPQVWTVDHPASRIACITLGHDGAAHELTHYQALLKNAFQWSAAK